MLIKNTAIPVKKRILYEKSCYFWSCRTYRKVHYTQNAKTEGIELSAFVDPQKFSDMDMTGVNIIQGDALNEGKCYSELWKGRNILFCSLEGDVLTMAKNIVAALDKTTVKRIIWITGMGIDHEITGVRGMMLNRYAKQIPEYIEAANVIAASKAVTTLLRCPGIQNGDNEKYELTKEGIQPSHRNVDRAAIAQCMADMIDDESMGVNDSLAITNAK